MRGPAIVKVIMEDHIHSFEQAIESYIEDLHEEDEYSIHYDLTNPDIFQAVITVYGIREEG